MRITRTIKTLALLAAVGLLSGCVTCRDGDIGSKNELAQGGGTDNIPLSIVENAVWLPYKLIATPIVGLVQGTVGWYEMTGEPISGTLTAPIGAAFGAIIGTVNGLGQEPFFVERDDNLFQVLQNPFITDQEIYKYTTPPHARPRYMRPPTPGVDYVYANEGLIGPVPASFRRSVR